MGRSSQDDNETNTDTGQATSSGYSYEQEYGSSKAMSESEAMARDIKDGRLNGFVGHGTVLTGETTFHSMLRVDGQLTGKVTSDDGTLIIGSTGQVDADVSVAAATISGTVNGDVIATQKLELGRTAKVVGNIMTPRLIIEDGAILEGSCSMVKAMEELEEAAAAEAETTTSSYSSTAASETDSEDDSDDDTDTSSSYSTSSYSYGSTDDSDDEEAEEDEDENADAATT